MNGDDSGQTGNFYVSGGAHVRLYPHKVKSSVRLDICICEKIKKKKMTRIRHTLYSLRYEKRSSCIEVTSHALSLSNLVQNVTYR